MPSATPCRVRRARNGARLRRVRPGRVAAAAALGLLLAPVAPAAPAREGDAGTVYVALEGDDAWSGGLAGRNADGTDGPFRTLARAAEALRPGGTCLIRAGTYREVLRPARSGAPGRPITFQGYRDEAAVLSGADALAGWARDEGDVWRAPMDWDLGDQNQLFLGDEMLTEARWPDNPEGRLLRPARATAASGTENTLVDPRLPGPDGLWVGATLWCAGGDRWICWSEKVTAFDSRSKTLTFDKPQAGHWYRVRQGSPYVLMGVRAALDAEGEWWYDRERRHVLLRPPKGADLAGAGGPGAAAVIEAKRRLHCIDLSGRSHVRIVGIRFRAGGVLTDGSTSDCQLLRSVGLYVGHSYVKDVGGSTGVVIRGRGNTVEGCELACSSSSVLTVEGAEHRVVNCYVHDGNYAGKWKGAVALAGRRHLVSHNTIRHSGRDLVSIHGLMESLIQHNDLSDAGWITRDLGMTYGHNTDFMNTVIRYNVVHDNRADGCAMGIYFDHCSQNAIVHHNAVYNAAFDPIRFNNPSYFNLVFNNSCWNSGAVGTFDHSRRNDLFGMRLANNVFNKKISLPGHVALDANLTVPDPGYTDPARGDFRLRAGSKAVDTGIVLEGVTDGRAGRAPDLGAFEGGRPAWKAGHDFRKPPSPAPRWEPADVAWMNLVRNSCFELETLEGWKPTGPGEASLAKGNGWGNNWGQGKPEKTGTNGRELSLGGGRAGVEQVVEGLHPGTAYTLSGWLKVSGAAEAVRLGVRHPDGKDEARSVAGADWTRVTVDFVTGRGQTKATVFVEKTSKGDGRAFADNLGLPRSPKGYAGQPPGR